MRSTPSEERFVCLPPPLDKLLKAKGLPEKTATLITGPHGTGKPALALHLATEWSSDEKRTNEHPQPPTKVLLVSFRVPETQYRQILKSHSNLGSRWDRLPAKAIRWFSVGDNFKSEHFFWELQQTIKDSRRAGEPVDRIVFDHVDIAESILPALIEDALFWPTLIELVEIEPITSFFVFGQSNEQPRALRYLRAGVDYCIRLERAEEGEYVASLEKEAGIWIDDRNRCVNYRLERGSIQE